jgi:hypothetical protein
MEPKLFLSQSIVDRDFEEAVRAEILYGLTMG